MTVFKQSLKKSILQIVFKIFITVLVGSAIFILDYSKGFGMSVGELYVVFVLLGLWYKDKRVALLLGVVAILLTILDLYLSS